jgi:hypothetical protein
MLGIVIVWILGVIVCGLSYTVEYHRYAFAVKDDSEWEDWRRPGGRWIGDRIPQIGAWEHAQLHFLSPARDPDVEADRRGAMAALVFLIAWVFLGLPIGVFVESLAYGTTALAALVAITAVVGTVIALGSAARLIVHLRRPDDASDRRGSYAWIAAGIAAVCVAIIAAAFQPR